MAAAINGMFEPSLQQKINESKILVVGAGGIGCEVLKNLVMSGFPDIEIVSIEFQRFAFFSFFFFEENRMNQSTKNVCLSMNFR